ncbi:MAG: hypothetical protein QF437_16055 [Planctomycetota bacterium]|jgi:hypothetical protein|nr:hypothetical protein [Planctomycetota bacterium]MDP7132012.1 hypothetical protein [Planctomycetota bacterium]MDP7248787.1 hypothetical protein [Planctomycetota bacterium]
MSTTLNSDILDDNLAVSLAKALAAANRRAKELGLDVADSLITISQIVENGGFVWRVNYGPKDYVSLRGGDLIIDLAPDDAEIRQVLRGQ